MIKKTANTADEFYEDWKKETISWSAGGTVDDYDESLTPEQNIDIISKVEKGSRASLGLDDSIEYYRYLQKVRLELIESGGIKDVCISCTSVDTVFNNPKWSCNNCNQSWDPLRLIYRGV